MLTIITIAIAYVLGSLSSAILLAKVMNLPDPREHGSGNPGATNMLRIGGKNMALYVLIGDVLKGFVAVLIAKLLNVHGFGLGLVALAAVVGHMYPVFFKFQGGKGVATALGALVVLSFWTAVVAIIIWLAVVFMTKYASLASVVAVPASPIIAAVFGHGQFFLPLLIMAGLVVWKHWENIGRLRDGTESKVKL